MPDVKVEFDGKFWAKIGYLDGVNAVVEQAAKAAEAEAKATAPYRTGQYHDSIHIEQVDTPHRRVYRLVASDWKSSILEARYGVLRRAARKAGNQVKQAAKE